MVGVWFQDDLPGTQQSQVLGHHIDIGAFRVQWDYTQILALRTIIPKVVALAEYRYVLNAQNLRDFSTQRLLNAVLCFIIGLHKADATGFSKMPMHLYELANTYDTMILDRLHKNKSQSSMLSID
jgi:hypothetical protein